MMKARLLISSLLGGCSALLNLGTPACRTQYFEAIQLSARIPTSLSLSVSSNEDLLPGISALNEANDKVYEQLENLRQTPYFNLYSVDILASCEYMPQELFECYSETCEVYPVDDEDVS